jgi:hypothetical protein
MWHNTYHSESRNNIFIILPTNLYQPTTKPFSPKQIRVGYRWNPWEQKNWDKTKVKNKEEKEGQ